MIINNTTKISTEGGHFIVLSDMGSEGLAVVSQHDTLEDAIGALDSGYSSQAIVELTVFDVSLTE